MIDVRVVLPGLLRKVAGEKGMTLPAGSLVTHRDYFVVGGIVRERSATSCQWYRQQHQFYYSWRYSAGSFRPFGSAILSDSEGFLFQRP
jgi:hypothetical protein